MAGSLRDCKLCRKLFSSSGKICQDCTNYLEEIYPPVRSFIRDSKNQQIEVTEIADALEINVKFIQGLVDNGYLGRDLPNAKASEDDDAGTSKLAQEFAKAANQLKAQAAAAVRKPSTYGQERYSGKK